ncbi:MAG: pyridoxal 5'-phosphate synthase glutaminase subunit PdxT [Candidatus Micrarchaeota archaeon]
MKVGVIGMQGAVSEHMHIVEKMGHGSVWVKKPGQLKDVSALIIPGGESTTISKLMVKADLFMRVRELGLNGFPIFGTCAGLILLAKKGGAQAEKTGQKLLGLMDIEVSRNAFGGQRESFEKTIDIGTIAKFPCVFIRAPAIKRVWGGSKALAEFNGTIVAAEQKCLLATSFHPELTEDTRVHEYFFSKV